MKTLPAGLAASLASGVTTHCWCWKMRRAGQHDLLEAAAARDASGSIRRFEPAYWTVEFNPPAMASVVTVGADRLDVTSIHRFTDSLVGLIWSTKDEWSHPLHAYRSDRDYRGTTLRFRWLSAAPAMPLDDVWAPVLTIESSGQAYYVRLWNHRVLPNPNSTDDDPFDQTIEIAFEDGLASGFSGDGPPVPVAAIDKLILSIIPAVYTTASHTALDPAVEIAVSLRDITITGGRRLACDARELPPHGIRLADGYDSTYNLTPERVVEAAWRLGYRDEYVITTGVWNHLSLAWNAGLGQWLIDPAADGLNAPAAAWHANFYERLAARGFECWFSISYAFRAVHVPVAWWQVDWEGNPAAPGYEAMVIDPSNDDAMDWLAKVVVHSCDLQVAAGLDPRFQAGEFFWWIQFDTLAPCIYSGNVVTRYNVETGLFVPTPLLETVDGEPGDHTPYLEWLRDLHAVQAARIVAAVKAVHPTAKTAVLLYTPPMASPWSGIVEVLMAAPPGWASPTWDRLQVEDYEWPMQGLYGEIPKTFVLAYETLGYAPADVDWFGGYPASEEEIDLYYPDWGLTVPILWGRIAEAMRRVLDRADVPAGVYIWARPQVARDGFMAGAVADPALGFTDHDEDVRFEATTFAALTGMTASDFAQLTGLSVDTADVAGALSGDTIDEDGLARGDFDGAPVELWRVDWSAPEDRVLVMKGSLGEVERGPSGWRAELRSAAHALAQPSGRLHTALCDADLGDRRCGVDLADPAFSASGAAASVVAARTSFSTADLSGFANGWFARGRLTWTSGANAGRAIEVKRHVDQGAGAVIELLEPVAYDIEAGDTFDMTAGCDKRRETCIAKFANIANHRGFPFMPGNDWVTSYPNRDEGNDGGSLGGGSGG